jgi:hypothetical protein
MISMKPGPSRIHHNAIDGCINIIMHRSAPSTRRTQKGALAGRGAIVHRLEPHTGSPARSGLPVGRPLVCQLKDARLWQCSDHIEGAEDMIHRFKIAIGQNLHLDQDQVCL